MSSLRPGSNNHTGLNFPQTSLRRNPYPPVPHPGQQNKQSPAPHSASPYQTQAYQPQQTPTGYPQHLFSNPPHVNGSLSNGSSRSSTSHMPSAVPNPLDVSNSRGLSQSRSQMMFPTLGQVVPNQLHHPQQQQQMHPQHLTHPSHSLAQPRQTLHQHHAQQSPQQRPQSQQAQPTPKIGQVQQHAQQQQQHHQQQQQHQQQAQIHSQQPQQQQLRTPQQEQQQLQHPQQHEPPRSQAHQQPAPRQQKQQKQRDQQREQQREQQAQQQQIQQQQQAQQAQQQQAQQQQKQQPLPAEPIQQQQQQQTQPQQQKQDANGSESMDIDAQANGEESGGLDMKMLADPNYIPTQPLGEMMSPPPEGGSYPTLEAVQKAVLRYCTSVGYAIVIGRSKKTVPGLKKVLFVCDRAGKPPSRVSPECRKRKTSSRKCDCPFGFFAIEQRTQWTIRYRPDPAHLQHNHGPSESPSHHPAARKLDSRMVAAVKQLKENGAGVSETLQILQTENPDCHLLPRDIYNARAAINRNPQKVATGLAENRPAIYSKPHQSPEDRIRAELRREIAKAREEMQEMEEKKDKEISELKTKLEEKEVIIRKFEEFIDICNERVMFQRQRLAGSNGNGANQPQV
ncbi:hypothetical protein QSH57_011093 [Fusarium oxysporum f. sp. vasinfectum]|nr:hypothetical protein QSH57_011093 [Fusarium oxysporum f. sp. vasinfectum]